MRLLALVLLAGVAAAQDLAVVDQQIHLRIDPAAGTFHSIVTARYHGTIDKTPLGEFKGVTAKVVQVALMRDGLVRARIEYSGKIADPVRKSGAATWVAGDTTAGIISEKGSYLVRGFYMPSSTPFHCKISVTAGDHKAVSVGALVSEDEKSAVYKTSYTVDGVVVVTGPWVVDEREIDGVKCRTYLYEPDRGNAGLLLDSLAAEIPRYQKLFGPVPDRRFDVVENFFATGYGFSNFTLLGDTVIRYVCAKVRRSRGTVLPAGYLDHELVHCWLGNYLHVDYEKGNWCEALTTYFTNYGSAVREKRGAAHRAKVSRSFSLRVDESNDYPLLSFKAKSHAYENDIGYGKGSMVFHMLARKLGEAEFARAVRSAIENHGGELLGWNDLVAALSAGAGQDLTGWFKPWLSRTGAPVLRLGAVKVSGNRIVGTVLQSQKGPAYDLEIPLRVTTETGEEEHLVRSGAKESAFSIETRAAPKKLALDPDHHIFRRVPRARVAPCMEGVTTAKRRVGFGDPALLKRLEIEPIKPSLPHDAAVLAIGLAPEVRNDILRGALAQDGSLLVEGDRFAFRGTTYSQPGDAMLYSFARPGAPGFPVTVFFGNSDAAYARTAYLPYYASHGWVIFRNGRPIARGEFPGDRDTRAEVTAARRGDPDPLIRDLFRLTDPKHGGRRTATQPAFELANVLRGRLVQAGAKYVQWPPVQVPLLRCSKKRTITLVSGDKKIAHEDAFFPMHASGSPARPAVFERVVSHPTDDAKGALVLLPEDAGAEIARGYEKKGAAAVAIVASEPTMKARGNDAAWPEALPPAVAASFEKRGVTDLERAVAGFASRAWGPRLGIPFVYLRPEEGARVKGHEGEGVIEFEAIRTQQTTSNIVGVFGEGKQRGVLLSAHWDGIGKVGDTVAQGAADNAAGVAVVLRVAERLKKDHAAGRLKRPVVVALFGAEEFGLWGSRQFAGVVEDPRCPIGKPRFAVNVDGVGSGGSKVYLIGRSKHPPLFEAFEKAAKGAGVEIGRDIDKFAFPFGSDHWPLHERGIAAVSIWSANYRSMNTLDDTVDRVDIGTLRKIVNITHRMVLDLATREE